MDNDLTVKISPKARGLAEERVAREGYSSVDDYVDALILDDNFDELLNQPWLQEKIEEGLKSGDAGLLTRERLRQLVDEGIALAEKDKR
ncbi:MAG TPA: hypothetical protein VHZ29_11060 [Rhizomicrobium sp.]|nr:hypothetical protein [Rhizomicrobium sp.]